MKKMLFALLVLSINAAYADCRSSFDNANDIEEEAFYAHKDAVEYNNRNLRIPYDQEGCAIADKVVYKYEIAAGLYADASEEWRMTALFCGDEGQRNGVEVAKKAERSADRTANSIYDIRDEKIIMRNDVCK